MKDGVKYHQIKRIEEIDLKIGERKTIETMQASVEGQWKRIRRIQWSGHVLATIKFRCVPGEKPQLYLDHPNRNGTMAKDFCCLEKCIGADCVLSIRRE